MSPSRVSEKKQAACGAIPGCLFRLIIPPLSVILIGIGFAVLLASHPLHLPDAAAREETTEEESPQREDRSPGLASLFTPQVLFWEEKIINWSDQKGLDPNLVATVMQIESCGDPRAQSGAGARGLFQVMPYHFKTGENPFHPQTNANRGLIYLKTALVKGGSVKLAFAGYNGGIQGAQRPASSWTAETKRFVYWGTGIYADAKSGKDHSPRLEEWLDSGGNRLCRQAQARLEP